ncbi:MAG: hypothetical protein II122_00100 [Bacteroidaceae bacterium]|nr:hypothetical protein [Bacteroidaceae bacterium]
MKTFKFFACTILFFACTAASNARIGYYYTENCIEYCDQLIVGLGDYEQDEYAAMIFQYGLHFISNEDLDTSPILIEVYRLGEEDFPR